MPTQKRVRPRVPKNATYEQRGKMLAKRLGIPVPASQTATAMIRMWVEIGMALAEEQPEFRKPGRREGFKPRPRPKDLEALSVARTWAIELGLSFNEALREVLPLLREHGLLEKSGDRTKDPKRLRRLHKHRGGPIFDLIKWDK